jgi:hypothetical protein
MALATFLNQDVIVYRRQQSAAVNDYGEASDTWVKTTTIKGLIQPKSGNVIREENGISVTSSHRLYCLITSNIKAGDKVEDDKGNMYNALYVGDAAGQNHHWQIDLRLIE